MEENVTKRQNGEPKPGEDRLTYEQLQELAGSLSYDLEHQKAQNRKLVDEINNRGNIIRDLQQQNLMQYMHLCFKVLKYPEYFSDTFITSTAENITKILTVMAEPKNDGEAAVNKSEEDDA